MRILISILLAFSTSLMAQTARETVEFNWINKSKKSPKGAQHLTIKSKANKAEVGLYIYLPEGYEKNTNARYPVIYALHGGSGNESSSLGRIRSLETAIEKKLIPPTILVMPNGGKGSGYQDSFDGSYMVKTMIIKELIPHIDKNFRTIPQSRARAIQGFSMGGGGSTRLALLYPDMFSSVANFASGALMRVDFDPGNAKGLKISHFNNKHRMMGDNAQFWKESIGYKIIEDNVDKIRKLGIRISFGKKDRGLKGGQDLSSFFKSLNIEHDFILHEGGHSSGWNSKEQAVDSFAFHNKHFKLTKDELKLLK